MHVSSRWRYLLLTVAALVLAAGALVAVGAAQPTRGGRAAPGAPGG